jgi:hypothetical protein
LREPNDDGENLRQLAGRTDLTWLNVGKFASLLGVNPNRLRQGHLDHLLGKKEGKSLHLIRFCEECWKSSGYHCALFDIQTIRCCPVHRCSLSEGCPKCLQELFRQPQLCIPDLGYGCSECGRMFEFDCAYFEDETVVTNELSSLFKSCAELVLWWEKVGQQFQKRDALLKRVLLRENTKLHPDILHFLDVELGFAETLAGPIKDWRFLVEPTKAKHVSFQILPDGGAATESISVNDQRLAEKSLYKSIRRFLYKRFVRADRAAYWRILSLGPDACLMLKSQDLCLPAFAFVLWRMVCERSCSIQVPSQSRRQAGYLLSSQYTMSLKEKAIWTYLCFFGILSRLKTLGENGAYRVVWLTGSPYQSFLCDSTLKADIMSGSVSSNLKLLQHVIYPDPDAFLYIKDKADASLGQMSETTRSDQERKFWDWYLLVGRDHFRGCRFYVNGAWSPEFFQAPVETFYI